nr:MAG TPA_asm: PcfJ-like protein [Caudoviricetes sp.]
MKPRTKLQFEVLENSKHLFDIENYMLSWARKDILEHKGFATKTRVICMDCGETFSPDLVSRKHAVCPHCHTKLKVEQTRKRTAEQRTYIASAEIYGEFQVIRNFELRSYHKSGVSTKYYISEILQHWILSNGKREVIARRHTVNWYCDSWGGYMEIQNKKDERKYDIYPQKYHPDSIFKTEYLKYGINKNLEGLTFLEAIKIVPENPKAETLLKAKRYDLLGCYCDYSLKHAIYNYWPSVKICLRNKYKIKDVKIWFDYLDLLRYFKKDLNNAHYVCPKDLKKEHDIYMKRKREVMRIEEMKRDYIRILKYFGEFQEVGFSYPKNLNREYQILVERQKRDRLEKKKKELEGLAVKYQKFIQPFLDIHISDSLIQIIPLQSIEDFKQEGDTLHHCVYTNEYFKKSDCLILSARINESILETIEIDIKNMKIVQCRGERNGLSEYHDRILKLMNKNMRQIKERLKPKKNGTKRDVNRITQAVDMAV